MSFPGTMMVQTGFDPAEDHIGPRRRARPDALDQVELVGDRHGCTGVAGATAHLSGARPGFPARATRRRRGRARR